MGLRSNLFQDGNVVFHHPYKVFYLVRPSSLSTRTAKIMISVPKRNFKRAIDRNRIKRQIRESYRLNGHVLKQVLTSNHIQIDLFFLYLPHAHSASSILSNKMESLLVRLSRLVASVGASSPAGTD